MLTSFLLTEVLQGKTPEKVVPKLKTIINRFEKISGNKVTKIEVDGGSEFKGVVSAFLKERGIRIIVKKTNASVEQVNAKMQRIFFNLVEQRRGYFLPTVKLAVKISNNTLNRRTGLAPKLAIEMIKKGETVKQKRPKAGPSERKRAWSVNTKVRALKKSRTKGDDLSYKSYKADHFGPVQKIMAVRFIGVYPKYKVGGKWRWQDEIIKAKPEDKTSHELIIKRHIFVPGRKKKAPKFHMRLRSQKKLKIGDKVFIVSDGAKREGVIDRYSKKNSPFDYECLQTGR